MLVRQESTGFVDIGGAKRRSRFQGFNFRFKLNNEVSAKTSYLLLVKLETLRERAPETEPSSLTSSSERRQKRPGCL